MLVNYVKFAFNQKGTQIDLSHFVQTLKKLHDDFIPYKAFANDDLDTGIDNNDVNIDSGIKIYTHEDNGFIFGMVASTNDIKFIPTLKDGNFTVKPIDDAIFINLFILNAHHGDGVYIYYRNSLSIHNFRRALNSHYDDMKKYRKKKNIIRLILGYEEFEDYIQDNFEQIDTLILDEKSSDSITEGISPFSKGGFVENQRIIKVMINSDEQTAFFKHSKANNFFSNIVQVMGVDKNKKHTSITKDRKKRVPHAIETDYMGFMNQLLSLKEFPRGFETMDIFNEIKSKFN